MDDERLQWLLTAPEPWTQYRTLVDLLDRPAADAEVLEARAALLAHPQVQALIAVAATWGQQPLTRHNDAGHPLYALSTLADFGLRAADPGMTTAVAYVLAHWAPEGAWQTLLNISPTFGGTGEDTWTWLACDAPTLLYALLAFGLDSDPRMATAAMHLADAVEENGWRCAGAAEIGKFKGPGRRTDPCPIANVYALKALSLVPDMRDSAAVHTGVEMLLDHWMRRGEWRPFLFGIGGDFRKLKYPFIWYDILHVVEVLSHFPFVWADARFQEMLAVITAQADAQGRYTATSMYRAWQGWSFANKKQPSPWLTFLVLRILKRKT